MTPSLDFSGVEEGYLTMIYYRWLSVETSQKDKATIQVNDGSGWQTIWQNTQNDNTVDTEWRQQLVDLSQQAVGKSSFRIAWVLETNNSQQFGGWNIDDVEICYTAAGPCDYFLYVGDSVAESQGNSLFFDITNGAEMAVELLGMRIGFSSESSLLSQVATQGYGPGEVWSADPAQPSKVEALFSEAVHFEPGQEVRFKLSFRPGQMRGAALTLQFITDCGESREVVIMVPE